MDAGGTSAELAAFGRLRDGDQSVRAELVDRYLPLVRHLARRYAGGSEPLEDLVQVGAIGLLNAIDRYDPTSGNAFSSYAVPTILGEIRRHFRDRTWAIRVPRSVKDLALESRAASTEFEHREGRAPTVTELAERLGTDVERLLDARLASQAQYPDSLDRAKRADDDTSLLELVPARDDWIGAADDALSLGLLTSCLSPRDRELVRLRYEEDLTQSDIAARVGLSQMHVSRLLRDALETLASLADGEAPGQKATARLASADLR